LTNGKKIDVILMT